MRSASSSSSATILGQTRYARVHLRAAQVLVGGDLAGRGLEQRRPGEKGLGAAAHHDHIIGQPGQIGAARGGGAVYHGDHRQAGRRQAREIVEQAAAGDEALDLVGEQIGAAALHQLDKRQLVLERDFLAAHDLAPAECAQGTCAYARIVRDHHAAHAADHADAGEHRRARDAARGIGIVGAVARQACEFEERRARIEQARQALARQQRAALVEGGLGSRRRGNGAALQGAQALDQIEHGGALLLKRFGVGIDAGLGRIHCCLGRKRDPAIMPCSRTRCAPGADGRAYFRPK